MGEGGQAVADDAEHRWGEGEQTDCARDKTLLNGTI